MLFGSGVGSSGRDVRCVSVAPSTRASEFFKVVGRSKEARHSSRVHLHRNTTPRVGVMRDTRTQHAAGGSVLRTLSG